MKLSPGIILIIAILASACTSGRAALRQESGADGSDASAKAAAKTPPSYKDNQARKNDIIPALPPPPEIAAQQGYALPAWLAAYLAGGDPAVEAMEEYPSSYVFVAKNRGFKQPPLEQWRASWSPDRDLATLVGQRVRYRFIAGLEERADDVYGIYFERAIKAAYSADYAGASREGDYWIKTAQGEYRYYILTIVPHFILESQILSILDAVESDPKAKRDQYSAFSGIRADFFRGF